jgi:hypothetical protein
MRSHLRSPGDELVEMTGAAGEIAELGFQRRAFGSRAVAVFKAKHGFFRQHRIDHLKRACPSRTELNRWRFSVSVDRPVALEKVPRSLS